MFLLLYFSKSPRILLFFLFDSRLAKLRLSNPFCLSAAERVRTVQEPGPAAAPAHVPDADALRRASGQRLLHQPGSHGDLRLQAQTALRAVRTKRGNNDN